MKIGHFLYTRLSCLSDQMMVKVLDALPKMTLRIYCQSLRTKMFFLSSLNHLKILRICHLTCRQWNVRYIRSLKS